MKALLCAAVACAILGLAVPSLGDQDDGKKKDAKKEDTKKAGPKRVKIGKIDWYVDYDAALAVAKKEKKLLWLHFGENPG